MNIPTVAQRFDRSKSPRRDFGRPLAGLLAVAVLCLAPGGAVAGGGPENVLLVVNANSGSSKRIANHYVELRGVPASNVVYLDWEGDMEEIPVAEFREKILFPALAAVQQRKLTGQIDYLVYSADLPWSVDLRADFGADQPPKQFAPTGSLTGVTYLWRVLGGADARSLQARNNLYAASALAASPPDSRAFQSSMRFGLNGQADEAGPHYLLSTMLAVTQGRGVTADQAIDYLTRAAQADGTRPAGAVYFVKNSNIRSRVRDGLFDAAAGELRRLGVRAEVLSGTLPRDKADVMGAMIGAANFDWRESGSRIQPGAICEHFTSFGGILSTGAGQTPLSEFLRNGAAGSSGTVVEPYAIAEKFPSPWLHVHYARGCSLAEAFYQSIAAPYQLLVVGDPLCQPWAWIPVVSLDGLTAGQTVRGPLVVMPAADAPGGLAIRKYRVFYDGRLIGEMRPGDSRSIDTLKTEDGYHELRVVAIVDSAMEWQGRVVVPFLVDNHQRRAEIRLASDDPAPVGGKIELSVQSPGAEVIMIVQNHRVVARLTGETGAVEIDAAALGRGPVALQAIAIDGTHRTSSAPLRFDVQ